MEAKRENDATAKRIVRKGGEAILAIVAAAIGFGIVFALILAYFGFLRLWDKAGGPPLESGPWRVAGPRSPDETKKYHFTTADGTKWELDFLEGTAAAAFRKTATSEDGARFEIKAVYAQYLGGARWRVRPGVEINAPAGSVVMDGEWTVVDSEHAGPGGSFYKFGETLQCLFVSEPNGNIRISNPRLGRAD